MGLRSFLGILPPVIPYSTEAAPAEALPLPDHVELLRTGAGPESLRVAVGDSVLTGENLDAGEDVFISTITGRVTAITPFTEADGQESVIVSVRREGEEQNHPCFKAIEDPAAIEPRELLGALARAGFAGFGLLLDGAPLETLVISVLDAEPLTWINPPLFAERSAELAAALDLVRRAARPERVTLAVPERLADQARGLGLPEVELAVLSPKYPLGLPALLALRQGAGHLLERREEGLYGNTLVISLEQLLAMGSCLREGRPFTEKTLSFSAGEGGLRNFRFRIGTPIADLLAAAGVDVEPGGKLIAGGPMTGQACYSVEQPLKADTDCLVVQAPGAVFAFQQGACTNCGRCVRVCPVGLEVNLLGRFSEFDIFEKCAELGVENCIECGLCAYVCPASRPLVHLLVHAKHSLKEAPPERQTLEQAVACQACGACSLRLFDTSPSPETELKPGEKDQK